MSISSMLGHRQTDSNRNGIAMTLVIVERIDFMMKATQELWQRKTYSMERHNIEDKKTENT